MIPQAARVAGRGAARRDVAAARDAASAGRWTARLVLAVIVAATAALRIRLLAVPLERDEGEFGYVAQLILRGEVPYVAAHNMKLPGVYYAYAGILALFGDTDVAIRIGLLVVNAASIALLYVLARRLFGEAAGLGAAVAYAVLSLGTRVLGFTANAEHFVVLPMLAGVLLLAQYGTTRYRATLVGAGLCVGLGVVMKQHGAAFVLFGLLYLARSGRRARATLVDVVVFAVAVATPFAVTCSAMAAAGAFQPFWFWTVTYAREYATLIPLSLAVRELGRQVLHVTGSASPLWLLAALGLSAPLWDDVARRAARFVLPFAACSFLAIVPGLRFSDHYFILLLPAVALLVGEAVASLGRLAEAHLRGWSRHIQIAVVVAALLLSLVQDRALLTSSPVALSRAVYGTNPFPEAVEIARYLREHTAPDEPVAVIGSEPEIYFYARRRGAATYMYTYPMMEGQPFARRMQQDMIAQLERVRPRFLVLVNVDPSWSRRPDSPDLLMRWSENVVNEAYRPVGVVDIVRRGPTSYRWDAAAADGRPRSMSHVVVFERRS